MGLVFVEDCLLVLREDMVAICGIGKLDSFFVDEIRVTPLSYLKF